MPDFNADVMPQTLHPVQSEIPGGFPGDPPPGTGAVVDAVAPSISNVTPAELTDLTNTPEQPLGFDVTDLVGLALALVWIRLPSGDTEVVHDGSSFTERYGAGSTRTAIAGGYRYSVRRNGGWPRSQAGTLSIRIGASDFGGNVV